MSELDSVLAHIESSMERAQERLFALLRLPSISADPQHGVACRACAKWHVDDLKSIGFSASARDTPGHPIVVAHDRRSQSMSALFYGHYDVQPVDPLNSWSRDPFDPAIDTTRNGTRVIRARGASDDKGQVMTFIEACRAWKTVTGKLPIPISILIEGEEESGSGSLPPFLSTHADELRADIGLICDTNMWDSSTPAITTMLRGLCAEEVTITAAKRDLHSGLYGSAAANPNRILARILADLHDSDGRVTVPEFYQAVPELPEVLRTQWAALNFDSEEFLGAVGLSIPAGEQGRSALEMIWSRPTCEINGMGGGYQDEGFKTVIPSQASAKVSFRLVFDQDPHAIRAAFREFVKARVPSDCRVAFKEHGTGRAIQFPIAHPAFQRSRDALSCEWNREAVFIGAGGSIPVACELKKLLGMDVILVGFALEDDNIHSPNEKYNLESFRRGIRSWARIMHALAQ